MISETLRIASEVVNGTFAILAASLFVMSAVYLTHELRAREWERPWTSGMRIAFALMILSVGVVISRVPIWEWRHFSHEELFGEVRAGIMGIGAVIGATGFLLANREISLQLYGNLPWMATGAAVLVFWAATAISYY